MTGILIAVFLGWAGGYRFYKKQILFGFIYLFTVGLFGIGWIVDIVTAIKANKTVSITINVVGTFAECRKNEKMQRADVVENLTVNCPLELETAYYEGNPFFLVVDPVSNLDIGALPKECSSMLKSRYPNAKIRAKLIKKDIDNPIIKLEV